jgi:microcystin-dependent protein
LKRSRFPFGAAAGEKGGNENIVLTESQLPAHTHAATTTINVGDDLSETLSDTGSGNILGGERRSGGDYQEYIYSSGSVLGQMRPDAATTNIGSTGAGQPVSIVPPFLGIGFIIRIR